MPEKENSNWAGVTKWLVIGVIAIVGIFVLKEPLGELIRKTENIEITESGFKLQTVQTVVGQVNVSGQTITMASISSMENENDNSVSFVDNRQEYYLEWPKDRWKKDDEMLNYLKESFQLTEASLYTIDMVCTRTEPLENGITPNVNVLIGPAENVTIEQAVHEVKRGLVGAEIIEEQYDKNTNGAILVYSTYESEYTQTELYYIQRFVMQNNKTYIITATTPLSDDSGSKEELREILNSFKVISG